jgi:hypothetical protein
MRIAIAALAVVALTGCSQTEDDARKEAFCADVPDLLQGIRMNVNIANTVGGDQAIDILSDQVAKLEAVEPPADVADEWTALVDTWTSFRDLLAEAIDSPPEEAEALIAELEPYQQRLTDTGAAVDEWGQANC